MVRDVASGPRHPAYGCVSLSCELVCCTVFFFHAPKYISRIRVVVASMDRFTYRAFFCEAVSVQIAMQSNVGSFLGYGSAFRANHHSIAVQGPGCSACCFFDSLKDMRRAPRFLRDFVLYELGFTDIQSLSDLLIRLTAIRLAPYMPTVSAIVQQLSVWVAVAMYRIHTTCDGNPKLLLMPVLRLPCGTKRRLDVGTTLHIFYEKRVGPGVLTLVNEGALDIGRRLGCMCERIVLGAYANKVYNAWRGARRFQVAFDGSDMNGMDWNIFVGSTRSIGLLCVMQPMV